MKKVSLPAEQNKHLVAMLLCINFQYNYMKFIPPPEKTERESHKTPNIMYMPFFLLTCRFSVIVVVVILLRHGALDL